MNNDNDGSSFSRNFGFLFSWTVELTCFRVYDFCRITISSYSLLQKGFFHELNLVYRGKYWLLPM